MFSSWWSSNEEKADKKQDKTVNKERKTERNDDDLEVLHIKMEHNLSRLNFINEMLTNNSPNAQGERIVKLEHECLDLKTQLHKANRKQSETQTRLEHIEEQRNDLQQKLDTLQDRHNIDNKTKEAELGELQEQYEDIVQEYERLQDEKQRLYEKWNRLQEMYTKEAERKDQLELLLRENTEELKITTEAVLERDQKLDQHEQSLLKIQQMMDEKDELLETYVKEAQLTSEETNQLLDTLNQLEKENTDLKEQLENQPSPIQEQELPYEAMDQQSPTKRDKNSTFESPLLAKLEPSKSNTRSSRIPVSTNQKTSPPQDYTLEIQQLKEDLAICNQKLMEKISQNKELESALERGNDHVEILRANLNEARDESAARYRKMLDLMEENRVLREALNSESKR